MLTAPAHFPGQGAVDPGPARRAGQRRAPAGDLAGRDLKPFARVLRRAPAVTVSSRAFTAYDPVTPAALTPTVVRGLLRGGLRFARRGDDATTWPTLAVATGGSQARAAVRAVRAGIDLLYVPDAAQRTTVYVAAQARGRARASIPRGRLLDRRRPRARAQSARCDEGC